MPGRERGAPAADRTAKAVIDAQQEVIRPRWRDATELTERERRQLFGREILNEYASRD